MFLFDVNVEFDEVFVVFYKSKVISVLPCFKVHLNYSKYYTIAIISFTNTSKFADEEMSFG